jgi:hypothetical protein
MTLGVGGVALWSALDTMSALQKFNDSPTQSNLDDGRAKEVRTNVLLGVSIGLAVVTTAAAVWLVDWGTGDRRAKLGFGLGGARVRGSF